MRILFVNKGDVNEVSGGYIYNKNIIIEGRSLGYEITYTDHLEEGYDLHIIDSLLIADSQFFSQQHLTKTVVLVHQLPKENQSFIERGLSVEDRNLIRYIVTGSETENDLVTKWAIKKENICKILPGIENGWKSKIVSSKNVKELIMVANYIPQKGYKNLLRLIGVLYDLDLKLACIGNSDLDPEFFSKISNEIKKNDPENRISLNSKVSRSRLNDEYLKADLLISLSESESYGMVIYEALCTGLPILMYRTGEWKQFDQYDSTIVIDKGNHEDYIEGLKQIISRVTESRIDSKPSIIRKSWKEVGDAFFNHCKKEIVK